MNEATSPQRQIVENRQLTKLWIIASLLISGFLLIPWCGLSIFASMVGWPLAILDEGYSIATCTFSVMMLYPLYLVASFTAAWILYAKRRFKWAAAMAVAPVILAILAGLLWSINGY